ncbi:hypothetical protein LZ30DRAFT_718049 [Colletotrichum cereale]|nr:hypothetical protein LZ30DRAFT_718049 [Colletotrichum cereale]
MSQCCNWRPTAPAAEPPAHCTGCSCYAHPSDQALYVVVEFPSNTEPNRPRNSQQTGPWKKAAGALGPGRLQLYGTGGRLVDTVAPLRIAFLHPKRTGAGAEGSRGKWPQWPRFAVEAGLVGLAPGDSQSLTAQGTAGDSAKSPLIGRRLCASSWDWTVWRGGGADGP